VARNYQLEIIAIVAIVAFCTAFLYASSTLKDTSFSGTDDLGAAKISGSSGTSQLEIRPLIPQWIPPSPEVESTLFALQAAVGGIFIGGVFGYWIGQKKKT
jgi:cobalt/nickel transport protein